MIYSLITAALILGIAAFFGVAQQKQLTELETRWVSLSQQAKEYDIPTDPAVAYAPSRLSHRASSPVQTESVAEFLERMIVVIKEIGEAEKKGLSDSIEIQQKGMKMFGELANFSGPEIKLFVDGILADERLDGELKNGMMEISIMILSQKNPDAALSFILEMEDEIFQEEGSKQHVIGTAIASLAKNDPRAAVDWLMANSDTIGEIDEEMRVQILREAAGDIAGALSIIDDLGFEKRSRAFGSIANRVTAENLPEFLKVARKEEESATRNQALRSLAGGVFGQDVEKAVTLLEDGTFTREETAVFLGGLDYYSLEEKTPQWLDWMVDHNKGSTANLIRDWTRSDYRAAGEWVNSVDKGPKHDQAKAAYASTLAEHEPAAAADWAISLPEGNQRKKVQVKIYRHWKKKDPAAAEAYARKNGLVPN